MAQMSDKETLNTLRALIKEVKQEKRTLKEGVEPEQKVTEGETLKEYVTKNIMEIIRESGA